MEGSNPHHFLTVLLLLCAITPYIKLSSAAGQIVPKRSTEFIRSSCGTTTYPRLCISSLISHASLIQTSPKLLANTALSVTLSTAKSTSAMMSKLSQSHGLKPKEVAAMQDCVEELSDSVDQLQKSLGEMSQIGGQNFGLMMNDVQTWVSAALTDEGTCSDGFAGSAMNGNLKNVVRGRIVNIAQLTSNALSLINSYASIHG